ncbi:MAG TPA: hypothetical protein VNK96_01220 [Fimbriimonadales bacterium]|nr:hypothetical protein [Fimbriimonadales bacterium]
MTAILAFTVTFLTSSEIHPAFVGQPDLLRKYYNEGREWRKKKKNLSELLQKKGCNKDIGKVRSLRGESWQAPNVTILTPNCLSVICGFLDEMEYVNNEAGEQIVLDKLKGPMPIAVFLVDLYAWPGTSGISNQYIKRAARPEDVQDISFVLFADNEKDPIRTVFREGDSKPVEITGTSEQSDLRSARIYSKGEYTTVFYNTIRTETYTAYNAKYLVVFPLKNEKGQVLISADAKSISFGAYRITHEHKADFILTDIANPK